MLVFLYIHFYTYKCHASWANLCGKCRASSKQIPNLRSEAEIEKFRGRGNVFGWLLKRLGSKEIRVAQTAWPGAFFPKAWRRVLPCGALGQLAQSSLHRVTSMEISGALGQLAQSSLHRVTSMEIPAWRYSRRVTSTE